jgi:5-methylcytosine-specific restriction endonuclease McrA
MKYIFWFFVAMFFIAFLTKNERSNYSYTPSKPSYGNQTPSYQPQNYYPQKQYPISSTEPQIQAEKPKKSKKKSASKKQFDEYDYQTDLPPWARQGSNSNFDWEKHMRESEKRMNELMKNSRFNDIDWEKQHREASARLEAMLNQRNSDWSTSSRNHPTTTYPQTYSHQVPSTSIWSSPSTTTVPSYSYTPSNTGTYTVNGTEYFTNETYSTTGQPKVKRSAAAKNQFLRSKGFSETPDGYEVDHIIPLSQGGSDTPDNMQLLTVEQHRLKTARERANTSSTGLPSSYFSTPTTPSIYSTPSTTLPNSNPVIHTGPRGGQYYINSNGNKTYIKKN